jgi:CSLREA domain-containing protein
MSTAFRHLLTLVLLLETLFIPASPPIPAAPGGNIVVTTLVDEFNSNGACSLREAITAANTNSPVDNCAAGDNSATDTITFAITGTVSTLSTLPAILNAGPLVIDGGEEVNLSGNNNHRVFYVNPGADLTLRGLTVSFGFVGSDGEGAGLYNDGGKLTLDACLFGFNNVDGIGSRGGGIYNHDGNLTISHSLFGFNNAAEGGAIYTYLGDLTITDSDFQVNQADYNGGGIYHLNDTLTISNTEFLGNKAGYGAGLYTSWRTSVYSSTFLSNKASASGGGIYGDFSNDITVTQSTFTYNKANSGGAISLVYSNITVATSNFYTNTASSGGAIASMALSNPTIKGCDFHANQSDHGGAIALVQAYDTSITDSTFTENNATDEGGAIHAQEAKGLISGSEFTSNTSGFKGGAIYNLGVPSGDSYLQVINSTFSENDALRWGGAIYNITGTLKLVNSTLVDNNANWGDSLANEFGSPGVLSTHNSILIASPFARNCDGVITDLGHNLENGDDCGFSPSVGSMINTDPLLGPLQDNGGHNRTYALLLNSPAINSANPLGCPDSDQRHFPRRTTYCDIGAYEAQPVILTILGGSNQSTDILTHFPQPLSLKVEDDYGNLLGGVEIRFDGPTSGAGISNSGASVTTNGEGSLAFTATANATPGGPYTVSASHHELITSYSLTNLVPTLLAITSDWPDPSAIGQPFPVRFAVSSSQGVPIGQVTVSVTARDEVCTGTLNKGGGSCTLAINDPGVFSLVAVYSGGGIFNTSSTTENHTVSSREGTIFLPLILGRISTYR